jgi:lipoprotein-anchoring transpeptidase ErfK/SrfK
VPAAAAAQDAPPAPEPFSVDKPSKARGATVARIVAPTLARRKLSSAKRRWRVGTQTAWSAQAQTLLVLEGATHDGRDWVKLLLANRPNGAAGWVPVDRVALSRTRYWVDVRTRSRRVTVYRNGKRVRRMRAVVGKPSTPTPHVLSAVYEINRQPNPRDFLGPWVLALTSFSEVLKNFGGGPGRVGIHGRAGASFRDPLGSARSHGCIRVDNRHISWMAAKLPLGTPVRMRP